MAITSAIVLFAVIWFMTLLIVLPFRVKSQGEDGEVVPGTPEGAPAGNVMKRKALITTVIASVLWAGIAGTIVSEKVSLREMEIFRKYGPPSRR